MQKNIIQLGRIRSINRVLQNHNEVFENKPSALALRLELKDKSDEVETAISTLLRPINIIRKPRQVSRENLIEVLQEFTGIGKALGLKDGDRIFFALMATYRRKIKNASYYKLCEIARQVKTAMEQNAEAAAGFGISAEKITAFDDLITSLNTSMEDTDNTLTDRRAGRNVLKVKLTSCSQLIREQLDAFAKLNQKEFPDFYTDYTGVRGKTSYRRRTAGEVVYEISGTVTDKATGQPLENAIVNVLGYDTAATTDADGYYLLEDLVAGSYSLTCQALAYEFPTPVAVTLANEEPVQLDFALTAVPAN